MVSKIVLETVEHMLALAGETVMTLNAFEIHGYLSVASPASTSLPTAYTYGHFLPASS